jgi:2-oxoisovalerate dehydrogenase E1 component alpha subunit
MTSFGEEASTVGSAAALEPADHVYAQYREQAALHYLGYSIEDMINQVPC